MPRDGAAGGSAEAGAMKHLIVGAVLGLSPWLGLTPGCQQSVPPLPPEPPADPVKVQAVNDIRSRWEHRSAEIRTIRAVFVQESDSRLFHTRKRREGRYAARVNSVATLDLFPMDEQGKVGDVEERFIMTTDELYQFQKISRHVTVLPRPRADQIDIIRKGGPGQEGSALLVNGILYISIELLVPDSSFLFLTMQAEKAKARYRIELVEEREAQYVLRFTPKWDGDRSEFLQAVVRLNKQTLLPDEVVLHSPNGQETILNRFQSIVVNEPIADVWFEPGSLKRLEEKKWTVFRVVPNPMPPPPELVAPDGPG
jgi:hypothetical protein